MTDPAPQASSYLAAHTRSTTMDRLTQIPMSGRSVFLSLVFVMACRFDSSIVLQVVISQGGNIGNGVAAEGRDRQM